MGRVDVRPDQHNADEAEENDDPHGLLGRGPLARYRRHDSHVLAAAPP